MESQTLSKAESLFLMALEANNEGKLDVAQLFLEMSFSLKESLILIDAHLFYIKILMGKRNWSLNQLKENQKKISEHIAFIRLNLIPSFDEKQRKLFSCLCSEFVTDFTSLVNHIDRQFHDDNYRMFYDKDEYYTNLKNKYFQQF